MALLKAGAEPAAVDATGATPRDLAAAAGHDRLMELLPAAAQEPRKGSWKAQGSDPDSTPSAESETAGGAAAAGASGAAGAAAAPSDEGMAPCWRLPSSPAGEAEPASAAPRAPSPLGLRPASASGGALVEVAGNSQHGGPGLAMQAGSESSTASLAGARPGGGSSVGGGWERARHQGAQPDQAHAEDDDAALVDALAAECTARQAAVAALAAEREGRAADAQARPSLMPF